MSVDVAAITLGLFEPRVTDHGAPVGFSMEGMTFVVRRAQGEQRIDAASCLGAAALIGHDGVVLGYGGMDVDDLEAIADATDAVHGPSIGTPVQRLARHGYALALPLDAMPDDVRDQFLAERLADGVLAMTRLDDASFEAARAQAHRHRRDEITTTDEPAVTQAEHDADVDLIVDMHGHALSSTHANGPRRTYTIGLADAGWPELVCFLPDAEALKAIADVVEALRSRDMRPADGIVVALRDGSSLSLLKARPRPEMVAPHAVRRARRHGAPPPGLLEVRRHRPEITDAPPRGRMH